MKKPLVIIAGPTAAGKTDFSIKLSKAIQGEIISADSMQVYRGLDIGSAKITQEEMSGVPHHLIDVLDPTEEFNIVIFQQLVKRAMNESIYPAGHIPILTGGTGFYIQSILYDIAFTEEIDDSNTGFNIDTGKPSIRMQLEDIAKEPDGPTRLYEELKQVDPEAALAIHPNNIKRVIRALEYFKQNHQKISDHNKEQKQKESPYNAVFFVLSMDREKLYERIDKRVDRMIEAGLVEEVSRLRDEYGCRLGMTSMQGIGYKEIYRYLEGECTLDQAIYDIKINSRHFAKRQLTWFRNFRSEQIIWLDSTDPDLLSKAMNELKIRGVI